MIYFGYYYIRLQEIVVEIFVCFQVYFFYKIFLQYEYLLNNIWNKWNGKLNCFVI